MGLREHTKGHPGLLLSREKAKPEGSEVAEQENSQVESCTNPTSIPAPLTSGFRNSFPKITSFPSTSKKVKIFWQGNCAPLVSSSWWMKELLLCWPGGIAATIWGKLGCTWVTLKHVRNWRSLRSAEPSQRMAHFLQSLMSSNSHHLIQQTLQWADFNTRVSPCSHINRDLEVCNGCDKIFGYIDVMYFFLSICKQDPNLFISSSFYLEDGGKEGCLKVAFKLWYRMKPGWLLRQMIIVMCRGDCFISQ